MTEPTLKDEEITARLAGSSWRRRAETIVRDLEYSDFSEAVAAVGRVAEVAEAANHHPDILLHGWNKLTLTLTNHAAGALTETDFDVSRRLDSVL